VRRLISAALLLPLLYLLVEYGGVLPFSALVVAVAAAGLREFYALAAGAGGSCGGKAGILLGAMVTASFALTGTLAPALVLTGAVLVLAVAHLLSPQRHGRVIDKLGGTLWGILYVGWLSGFLIALRRLPEGHHFLYFLFLVIMIGDTFAYYVGSSLGRRPLASQISPKKTVEGAVAGFGGSLAAAYGASLWFLPVMGGGHWLAAGSLLAVAGQLADLVESMLKRSAGVKDSGGVIPGHGGILDRLDSLLFGAPLLYFYARYLLGMI